MSYRNRQRLGGHADGVCHRLQAGCWSVKLAIPLRTAAQIDQACIQMEEWKARGRGWALQALKGERRQERHMCLVTHHQRMSRRNRKRARTTMYWQEHSHLDVLSSSHTPVLFLHASSCPSCPAPCARHSLWVGFSRIHSERSTQSQCTKQTHGPRQGQECLCTLHPFRP